MKSILIFLLILNFEAGLCQSEKIDYSYPPLIAGSNFGIIFQRLYKLSDYSSMIRFTSKESINRFSSSAILKYYQSMQFGYEMKLKSFYRNGDYYQLNYQAKINATVVIVRMKVIVDTSDSAKVVLPEMFSQQQIFLYK